MNIMKHIYGLACLCIALVVAALQPPAAQSTNELGTLHTSMPLASKAGSWHTWKEHINLKPGEAKERIFLTFINGGDGRPAATDMKATLNGQILATFKDFNGGNCFSRELTGELHAGDNTLVLQGFGPSGARVMCNLFIEGKTAGREIPTSSNVIDRNSGPLVAPSPTAQKVVATSYPQRTLLDLPAYARSTGHQPARIPQVTGVNMLSSPPNQPVTIFGRGFSPIASDNVVMVGSHQAHVLSATSSNITFAVPSMNFPDWHQPVKVITRGVPSRGNASINVDMRVVPNQGVPMN